MPPRKKRGGGSPRLAKNDETVAHFRMPVSYFKWLRDKARELSRKSGRTITVAEYVRRDIEKRMAAERTEQTTPGFAAPVQPPTT